MSNNNQYYQDFSLGELATPPWQTAKPLMGGKSFPIPPRNNHWNAPNQNVGSSLDNGRNGLFRNDPAGHEGSAYGGGVEDRYATDDFMRNTGGGGFMRQDGSRENNLGSLGGDRYATPTGNLYDNQSGHYRNDGLSGSVLENKISKFLEGGRGCDTPHKGIFGGNIGGGLDNRGNIGDHRSSGLNNNSSRGTFDGTRAQIYGGNQGDRRKSPLDYNGRTVNNRGLNLDHHSNYERGNNELPWKMKNTDNYKRNSSEGGSGYKSYQDIHKKPSAPSPVVAKDTPSNLKPVLNNALMTEDLELEEKALNEDVSEEFFDKIKPLSLMQVAADVALRYARKEFHQKRGNNGPLSEKPTGIGQYTCKLCYCNFLTKEKLNTHNNSSQHKELEDFHQLKKEQARLIMEKRITGPSRAKAEMMAILRAEKENNLKPTEMELDMYILGVYESVMKPYWPVPKSKYYCRVCNYVELKSESELSRHNITADHKRKQASYEDAFCLYCQKHYYDKDNLEKHITNPQHKKVRDLMERTKECAVDHWHKVNSKINSKINGNKVKTNGAYEKELKATSSSETSKTGVKRSGSGDDNRSPVKKPSISISDNKSTHSAKTDVSHKRDNLSKVDSKYDSDSKKSDRGVKAHDKTSPSEKKSNVDKKSSPTEKKSDPKKDIKVDSKSDRKDKDTSKGSSKSDVKSTSKVPSKPADSKGKKGSDNNSKSSSKPSKSAALSTSNSLEKDKLWFAPITGFLCIACHNFVADEAEQKKHLADSKHIENVTKLKSLIAD